MSYINRREGPPEQVAYYRCDVGGEEVKQDYRAGEYRGWIMVRVDVHVLRGGSVAGSESHHELHFCGPEHYREWFPHLPVPEKP